MYQISRAIYRQLADDILDDADALGTAAPTHHERVLHACEDTVRRLAFDRHYFANPTRTLFNDIRAFFPMSSQTRVWAVIDRSLQCADAWLARQPRAGYDAAGNRLQCRATTRRGTACQRMPLAHNGYCPSHQHLAETESVEAPPLAA